MNQETLDKFNDPDVQEAIKDFWMDGLDCDKVTRSDAEILLECFVAKKQAELKAKEEAEKGVPSFMELWSNEYKIMDINKSYQEWVSKVHEAMERLKAPNSTQGWINAINECKKLIKP